MANAQLDVFHALDSALAAAVAAAAPSTVHIRRGHGQGGTGIVWAEDLVITSNFHCPDKTTVGIATSDGNLDEREAEVIGRDAGTDLAVLRVAGGGLTPAVFRELDGLAIGNLALALGRPGKTARASLRAIGVLGPSVDTPRGGTLDRYLESDRQIPRGFAGGPLIDADGKVLGLNTRTLLRGADLAIPTATIKRVVAELIAHGGIRRGYFGVGAYPTKGGALIASLEDGGPAAQAGLLVGDIITTIDGAAVDGPDALREVLNSRPGKQVKVSILRAGQPQELDVTIGSRS
ncbi:MAG: trypsin-like peptidase domain-containing protein [Kofleriaceae bacterium]